jgi:hypothetical protein
LWKFSTTTPTNMLSTKKLTMSRKEMKYSSIQGLWFCTGCGKEAVGPPVVHLPDCLSVPGTIPGVRK